MIRKEQYDQLLKTTEKLDKYTVISEQSRNSHKYISDTYNSKEDHPEYINANPKDIELSKGVRKTITDLRLRRVELVLLAVYEVKNVIESHIDSGNELTEADINNYLFTMEALILLLQSTNMVVIQDSMSFAGYSKNIKKEPQSTLSFGVSLPSGEEIEEDLLRNMRNTSELLQSRLDAIKKSNQELELNLGGYLNGTDLLDLDIRYKIAKEKLAKSVKVGTNEITSVLNNTLLLKQVNGEENNTSDEIKALFTPIIESLIQIGVIK